MTNWPNRPGEELRGVLADALQGRKEKPRGIRRQRLLTAQSSHAAPTTAGDCEGRGRGVRAARGQTPAYVSGCSSGPRAGGVSRLVQLDKLDRLVAELDGLGVTARSYVADLTDRPGLAAALARVEADFGAIDVLEFSPVPGR